MSNTVSIMVEARVKHEYLPDAEFPHRLTWRGKTYDGYSLIQAKMFLRYDLDKELNEELPDA